MLVISSAYFFNTSRHVDKVEDVAALLQYSVSIKVLLHYSLFISVFVGFTLTSVYDCTYPLDVDPS